MIAAGMAGKWGEDGGKPDMSHPRCG